jgi:hypothetical protein
VHSETQDGKSLLDAHFAHATAVIKRFLRRVRQNLLNKVTSPAELAEALADQGGLKHCGVQLLCFDAQVSERLASIKELLEPAAKEMTDFFSRANEYRYFPEDDSDEGRQSTIQVVAYSGVGEGATFAVDVAKGTVSLKSGSSTLLVEDEARRNEDAADDDEGTEETAQIFTEEEEEVEAILEPFYLMDANDSPSPEDPKTGRLLSTNGDAVYNCHKMLTFVKVERVMRPIVLENGARKKKIMLEAEADEAGPGTEKIAKTVLARAIQFLSNDQCETRTIHQALCRDLPEYKMAESFCVPDEFKRDEGWARRPRQGEYYGKRFIGPYKDELQERFDDGKRDGSRKMSADQMCEWLAKKYPGVYTLPSVSEIDSFISQCIKNDKNAQARTAPNSRVRNTTQVPSTSEEEPEIETKYSEAISAVLEECQGNIMPRFVANRVACLFQNDDGFIFGGRGKDSTVPKKCNDLIKKIRDNINKQKKRYLIG